MHDASLPTVLRLASTAPCQVMRHVLVAAILWSGCFDPTEDESRGSEESGLEGQTQGTTGPVPTTTGPVQTTTGSAGPATECAGAEDCTILPAFGACEEAACVGGRCVAAPKPAGAPLPEPVQIAGDCQRLACDGAGAIVTLVDDEDTPRDGVDCTLDTCQQGIPSNVPVTEGTPCTGGECDAAGRCVGCSDAQDCDPGNEPCANFTCVESTCGTERLPAGTLSREQSEGNCERAVCDGAGNLQFLFDPQDVPESGEGCGECRSGHDCIECLTDAECDDGIFCNGDEVCSSSGICTHTGSPCAGPDEDEDCFESCDESLRACVAMDPPGSSCGESLWCNDGGMCVACLTDLHCGDAVFCNGEEVCTAEGTCEGGESPCPGADGDPDCSETCDEEYDACTAPDAPGASCGDTEQCNDDGVCVGCLLDTDCDDGAYCNGVETCGPEGVCEPGTAPCPGADGDDDCSESCSETSDTCSGNDPFGSTCGSEGQVCSSGQCTCGPNAGRGAGSCCDSNCEGPHRAATTFCGSCRVESVGSGPCSQYTCGS